MNNWLNKTIIILCSILIGHSVVLSQAYINNLYDYQGTQEFSRSIHKLNDGSILNTSVARIPSMYNNNYVRILRLIDGYGVLLWEDIVGLDTVSLFGEWRHTSQIVGDSLLIILAGSTHIINNDNFHIPYFLKYDIVNQQLIDIKFYPTTFGSTNFSTIYHTDGFIYGGGQNYNDSNWDSRDINLLKLDLDGNLIWQKTIDFDQRDLVHEIESFGVHLLISGYETDMIETVKTYIAVIDTAGFIGNLINPVNLGGAGTMETEVNINSVYFVTESDSIITDYNAQYISKWDSSLNLVWEKYVSNTSNFDINYRRFEILDEQIIIGGTILEAEEYTNNNPAKDFSYISGWSLDGELNWEHEIYYDEFFVHHVDDIIATEAGDLVFMGTVFDGPEQFMWLFKTDSEGCGIVQDTCYYSLEEYFGIDTLVSVTEYFEYENIVEVFGNPFNEQLVFRIFPSNYYDLHYEILGVDGTKINLAFKSDNPLQVINTQHWQSGIYILNVYDDNVLVGKKKLLKL